MALSRLTGLTNQTISNLETERNRPQRKMFQRLTAILGSTLVEAFRGTHATNAAASSSVSPTSVDAPTHLAPYRSAERPTNDASASVRILEYDPGKLERALTAHADAQNALAALLKERGLVPLSPGLLDPDFDLAWLGTDSLLDIVEVKSRTDANETSQLRVGIGQPMHYAAVLADVDPERKLRLILALESQPRDALWSSACARCGVQLTFGPNYDNFLNLADPDV